jgi:hypothetical protein
MSTPLAVFGPGILIVQRTDIAIPSPVNIGYAQEFSLEAAGTIKELYGQYQWPLAVARGTIKGTGKVKAAVLSGLAWAAAFYGGSGASTTGQVAWNVGSTYSLSTAATSLQVGSSLTFDADLGITYGASTVNAPGLPFQRVSTGNEALGKYSITTGSPGLYNFSAADTTSINAGATNPIKVTYTNTTSTGQSLLVANQLIGSTPTFQLDYYTNLNQPTSKPFAVRVYQCVSSKHMIPFKLEDFGIPEFDLSFFANASGNVFNAVFPEIS